MFNRTHCSLAALAVGFGLAFGAAPAVALDQFTVDETYAQTAAGSKGAFTVNLGTDTLRIADDLQFGYLASITLAGTAAGGTFSETGSLQFTAFKLANATVIPNGLPNNYQMVANFSTAGTWAPVSASQVSADFTAFSMNLYLVTPSGSVGPRNGSDQYTPTSDYTLIGTASLDLVPGVSDANIINCPVNSNACGNWDIIASINLNAEGSKYFVAPVPFYLDIRSSGNNQGPLQIAGIGTPFADQGSGDATLFDFVPEPASLTLLGSALLGLGFGARRRRKRVAA